MFAIAPYVVSLREINRERDLKIKTKLTARLVSALFIVYPVLLVLLPVNAFATCAYYGFYWGYCYYNSSNGHLICPNPGYNPLGEAGATACAIAFANDASFACPEGHEKIDGRCVGSQTNRKQPRNGCEPKAGDPIIIANGNSFQTEIDYQSHNPLGLAFIRYYNSTAYNIVTNTNIGVKWQHPFNRRVSAFGTHALVYRSNGQAFTFNYSSNDDAWLGDADIADTLVELKDETDTRTGWEYRDSADTLETYNAAGQLLSITNRAGHTQTLAYDITAAEGGDDNHATLDKVTGAAGDTLQFTYDNAQRINSLTDPEGNIYHYHYDDRGNLLSVTYPDTTPLDTSDNPLRRYHYEDERFPHHLTGLTNETGSRVTWEFDSEGRAISSALAGGVDKSTLDYRVADQVTVTHPLGKQTTYHFTTLHGVKKVTQVEGHASDNCAAAHQAYSYDANGYLASKTDWAGNITRYTHNERGLETTPTEAADTPQARTITTEWHHDFRLPIRISKPGNITELNYNEQGQLISTTIRAAENAPE